jgi:hypothetical protein
MSVLACNVLYHSCMTHKLNEIFYIFYFWRKLESERTVGQKVRVVIVHDSDVFKRIDRCQYFVVVYSQCIPEFTSSRVIESWKWGVLVPFGARSSVQIASLVTRATSSASGNHADQVRESQQQGERPRVSPKASLDSVVSAQWHRATVGLSHGNFSR